MDVIRRGKCDQGLTCIPRLRRNWLIDSLSTMRNSRPNLHPLAGAESDHETLLSIHTLTSEVHGIAEAQTKMLEILEERTNTARG